MSRITCDETWFVIIRQQANGRQCSVTTCLWQSLTRSHQEMR